MVMQTNNVPKALLFKHNILVHESGRLVLNYH